MSFPLLGGCIKGQAHKQQTQLSYDMSTINDQIPTLSSLPSLLSLTVRVPQTRTKFPNQIFFFSFSPHWDHDGQCFFFYGLSVYIYSFFFFFTLLFASGFALLFRVYVFKLFNVFFFCFSASCHEGLSEPNAKSAAPLDVF